MSSNYFFPLKENTNDNDTSAADKTPTTTPTQEIKSAAAAEEDEVDDNDGKKIKTLERRLFVEREKVKRLRSASRMGSKYQNNNASGRKSRNRYNRNKQILYSPAFTPIAGPIRPSTSTANSAQPQPVNIHTHLSCDYGVNPGNESKVNDDIKNMPIRMNTATTSIIQKIASKLGIAYNISSAMFIAYYLFSNDPTQIINYLSHTSGIIFNATNIFSSVRNAIMNYIGGGNNDHHLNNQVLMQTIQNQSGYQLNPSSAIRQMLRQDPMGSTTTFSAKLTNPMW